MTPEQQADLLYSLDLHSEQPIGPARVMRVPGGWVYTNAIGGMCFVPFHNEFQDTEEESGD